jgi:hypothetical protein
MKKYDQHKMKRTQIRHQQKEDGFFDGRFVSRTEKPKNLYNRKFDLSVELRNQKIYTIENSNIKTTLNFS